MGGGGEYKNHSNPYIQGTTAPCDSMCLVQRTLESVQVYHYSFYVGYHEVHVLPYNYVWNNSIIVCLVQRTPSIQIKWPIVCSLEGPPAVANTQCNVDTTEWVFLPFQGIYPAA